MVYLLIGGRYCTAVVVGQPRRPCFCVVVLVLGALVACRRRCWLLVDFHLLDPTFSREFTNDSREFKNAGDIPGFPAGRRLDRK